MNLNKLSRRLAVCLALFFVFVAAVAAQTGGEETGKNEFGIWGGFSPDSSTLIKGTGRTEDARFGIVALRYARRFDNNNAINLKYTADAVPVSVLSFPEVVAIQTGTTFGFEQRRKSAYGWGIAPLGLQMNFRPRKKVQPFIGASGGFLYFNKQIPNFLGTRFNFTADVGGGVEFRLDNGRAFTVGYKYHHISNAARGQINPGYDNNLFYVGYSFSR